MRKLCVLSVLLLMLCGCGEAAVPADYAVLASEWLAGDISFSAELAYGEETATLSVSKNEGVLSLEFLSPESLAGLGIKAERGGELTLCYAEHSVALDGELPAQSPVAALAELFIPMQPPTLSAEDTLVRGGVHIYSFELRFSPDMRLLSFAFPNLGIKGRVL